MENKNHQPLFKKLALGWTCAILFATLNPSDGQPLFEIPIPHFDKIVHFGLFFIYAILIGLSQNLKTALWFGAVLGIGLGVFTEYMQTFVPGRQTDLFDGLADACGTILGLLTVYIFRTRFSDT